MLNLLLQFQTIFLLIKLYFDAIQILIFCNTKTCFAGNFNCFVWWSNFWGHSKGKQKN